MPVIARSDHPEAKAMFFVNPAPKIRPETAFFVNPMPKIRPKTIDFVEFVAQDRPLPRNPATLRDHKSKESRG